MTEEEFEEDIATAAPLSNNPPPTALAQDLLEKFARAPMMLDADTAPVAVVLAKQMRLEMDDLEEARKKVGEPLRAIYVKAELPYKTARVALMEARAKLMLRIEAYRREAGVAHIPSEYGPTAHGKRAVAYRVVDISKVPRAFLNIELNHTAVKNALKAGQTIEGIERLPDIEKTEVR